VKRKRERRKEREHRWDREVASATYRAERAREGRGYRFQLPPSLREKA
jgi:hypothetical protein